MLREKVIQMADQEVNIEELLRENDADTDLVKNLRKVLKAKDSELRSVNQQYAETQRNAVFSQLGIDPAKGVGKLFAESYKGEYSEEAVRAAAEEYDLIKTSEGDPDPQGQVNQQNPDMQAFNASRDLAQGSGGNFTGEDPAAAGREAYSETFKRTGNNEEAMAAHFAAQLEKSIAGGTQRG